MKTTIYYFSGTGNSLQIAKELAFGLGDCTLQSAKEALLENKDIEGERIGLVFPVYMYRVPHLMVQLIKRIKKGNYIFAVANNAGAMGKSIKQVNKILNQNHLKVNSGFSVRMPSNYIPWGGAATIEKLNETYKSASEKIKKIIQSVQNQENLLENETSFLKIHLIPGILYWLGYKMIPVQDKSFKANDSCSHCGICAKVCPVGNIHQISQQKPVWNHRCEMCFACLQWCPTQAIDFGKKTAGKKRYTHPKITLKEMLGK